MVNGDIVMALVGGAVGGGFAQGVGAWFIFSRLKKVDRVDKKLDQLIAYQRLTDSKFDKFWKENGD